MEKRRQPRALTLTLPDTKQPYLVLEGKSYTLRNFSEDGIGVWVTSPPPFGITKGRTVSGDVAIENTIFPVKLELMHVSDRILGLKIVHKSEELTRIFKTLLEPANYAISLEKHRDSGQVDIQGGYSRLWYVGRVGTELLVWYNESLRMVMALQICWGGIWVFRQQGKLPLTGQIKDESMSSLGILRDNVLIRHDSAKPIYLQQAAVFLSSCPPPLPGHLLWQFLETGEQVYLPQLSSFQVA